MRISNFKQAAVEVSRRSYAKYHQHGALLIRNGRIISSGVNDEFNHAEVNAIKKVYCLLPGLQGREEG